MKIKKLYIICILLILVSMFVGVVGLTWSVFTAQSQTTATTFKTGRPELRLIKNLMEPVTPENTTNSLQGSTFLNISSGWLGNYPLELYNQGTVPLQVELSSNVAGGSIGDLNEVLWVKAFTWNDMDNDGIWMMGEDVSEVSDWVRFDHWLTQPIALGNIMPGNTMPLVLHFKIDDISNNLANTSGAYDFVFNGQGLN